MREGEKEGGRETGNESKRERKGKRRREEEVERDTDIQRKIVTSRERNGVLLFIQYNLPSLLA